MASPEFLIIMRELDPELLDRLRREFQDLAVIVDRRGGERRQATRPAPVERRRGERRDRAVRWNALGFVVRRREA
jgi:hypothetical protein